jgi:hypothetical protein
MAHPHGNMLSYFMIHAVIAVRNECQNRCNAATPPNQGKYLLTDHPIATDSPFVSDKGNNGNR